VQSPDAPNGERRFLTPEEVAKMLKVSVSTVNRLIRRGQLGFCQISPRTRRVPSEAIDAYIRNEMSHGTQAW
jgi:excisionase family DNA binding protein